MLNMKKLLLSIAVITILTGCSEANHDDIKVWMAQQEQQLKGKIPLLPPAKSYTPVVYKAETNPFTVKEKISLVELIKDKYAPDTKREKENLEDFPLESLKMVGTVIKDGKFYAMISDPNKGVNYVTVGNYMGKNYGQITEITEGEIVLEERLKNNEQWVLKTTKVALYEGSNKK
jgi:type IV pilus assembly protein PilP